MQNENKDYLIFTTLEYIDDADEFNLVTGKMYQIMEYNLDGTPIIILDNDDYFVVVEEELQYVVIYKGIVDGDLISGEEKYINDILDATTEVDNEVHEYDLNEEDCNGMINHAVEKYNGLEKVSNSKYPDAVKLAPKYEENHKLNEKEVNKISNWLDDLVIENAINYSIENKDLRAFKKLGHVLRHEFLDERWNQL